MFQAKIDFMPEICYNKKQEMGINKHEARFFTINIDLKRSLSAEPLILVTGPLFLVIIKDSELLSNGIYTVNTADNLRCYVNRDQIYPSIEEHDISFDFSTNQNV